ncbi:uncharacterized protein LOC135211626 [Macrobrachium nipponense]|uniref:uncharacterized protein LOC135211626 n=1 Tax=Macrobrachium nipponense TaxID=159736 RepID=UPI0030C7B608
MVNLSGIVMEIIENVTINENLVLWGMVNASMGLTNVPTSSNDNDIFFSNAEEEKFENFPFSISHIYEDTSLLDFSQNTSTLANFPNASSSNSTPSAPSSVPSSSSSATSTSIYETFMDESRHWVQKVLVPLVMCVGVVGNSVSMVVLTRRKMRSSTNSYLTALAISDLLYLIFVFFLSLKHHPDMQHPRHWLYWQHVRYALWLTDASSSTSIWLTVTFTIERYVVVSHPIKGKVLCTVSRAKKFVVVVYCVCWLLTATTPHEWIVVTKTRYPLQDPRLDLDYSALGRDPTYRHFYYWFTAVTFILLPLCLLVVFNGFLMQAVRRSKQQRRRMTMVSKRDHYSHQQEYKITVMLIAVVLLSLLCQMPTAVLLLYSTVYQPPQGTSAYAIMRGLGNIFNFLNAINAAANFLLYCAFSDKFRRTFLITFFPCLYKQHFISHSFVATSSRGDAVGGRRGRRRGTVGREREGEDVRAGDESRTRSDQWRVRMKGGRSLREPIVGVGGVGRGDMANKRREEECMERERGNSPEDKKRQGPVDAPRTKSDSSGYYKNLAFPKGENPTIISELFKGATQRGQSPYLDPLTGVSDQKNKKDEIQDDFLICPQDGGTVHMGVAPLSPSSSWPNSGMSRGAITSDCTGGQETLGLCKSIASQREVHPKTTESITKAANGVHKNTLVLNALVLNASAESANIGTTTAFRFIDDPLSDESNVSVDQIH